MKKVLSYIKEGILGILGFVLMALDRIMWSWNPFVHLPSINFEKGIKPATEDDTHEYKLKVEALKDEAKQEFTLKYINPAKKRLALTTVITGSYLLFTWIF